VAKLVDAPSSGGGAQKASRFESERRHQALRDHSIKARLRE